MSNAFRIRIIASIAVISICIAAIAVTGITKASSETSSGVMIDFGYYNVSWTPTEFDEGKDAYDVLSEVCEENDFEAPVIDNGIVISINGVGNLQRGVEWGLYHLSSDRLSWIEVYDIASFSLSGQSVICWARASDASEIMPASDTTGFIYYGYADEGITHAGESIRAVSLTQSVTETVIASGGGDYLVGTDRDSLGLSSLKDLDTSVIDLGSGISPNFEKIVSAHPDIVFLDGSITAHCNVADKLRKANINCVTLYEINTVNDVYRDIWIASSALGFSEHGNDYLNRMSTSIRSVTNIFNTTGKVAVLSSTDESPYVYGSGTFADSILNSLGLVNAFKEKGEFRVSAESLYEAEPDVIVIVLDDSKIDSKRRYNSLLDGLGELWKETPAYNSGFIYVFSGESSELFDIPGPRVSSALELTAKVINQDAFSSVFPSDKVYNYFCDDYRTYLIYQDKELIV